MQRSILLVSDGQDTVVFGRRLAEGDAIDWMTDEAAAQGIRVYTFGMGQDAVERPHFLKRIAARTNGRYVEVADPATVVHELPRINFAGLVGVEIANLRSGETGRAIRVFPDGTFDGYAPLVEGANVIRVRAVLDDGQRVTRDRSVEYHRPAEPTLEHRERAKVLLEELRTRTLETELAKQALSGPPPTAHREIEVVVEE